MTSDNRTLAQLAAEALQVQNAVNLSGVVHGWSRSITRLRELLPEAGTDQINRHPVNVLYADKCADLTKSERGVVLSNAYAACHELAESGKAAGPNKPEGQ